MTDAREGQTFAGRAAWVRYVNFVKLPHTVFALPFALVGAVLATRVAPVTPAVILWIIVAFTAARFAAMGFNRIADRQLDALNPRTRSRELPAGAISLAEAWVSVLLASAIFVVAAWQLNPLCLLLSPVALAWVFFYSYTKRFTSWSHVVLGLGLAIAPVGGYLAVAGAWSEPWWMLASLAIAVATWVAGFDVLYALQDVEFDREHGLFSVPVLAGEHGALLIARTLHVVTAGALIVAGLGAGLGALYWIGVAVAAALLAYEHSLVIPGDLSKLDAAFFTMNGVISITFFGFVLLERTLA
ncbi:MAG TPA: UbiA-like polyprenyltransferase [Gemmatimonadaceae bacterium]